MDGHRHKVPAGKKIRANGCDFYTFRAGLVVKKNSIGRLSRIEIELLLLGGGRNRLASTHSSLDLLLHSCEFFVFGAKIREAFLLGKVTREWRSLVVDLGRAERT